MPEQHWRDVFRTAVAEHSHSQTQADALIRALQPHFEAAYARGVMAGRSQRGYREKPAKVRLTDRQLEIARLAAGGLTNEEIATRLFVSVDTVRTHMHNALKRTGARSRGHLAALLATQGQITDVNVPDPEENACPEAAPSAGSPTRAWTTEVANEE